MRSLGVPSARWWSLGGALRSFWPLGVGNHRMRALGAWGVRWWSLGGAHRRFMALGVENNRMHRLGVRGDRWWSGLGGALRSFPHPPRFQCVPKLIGKKLRSALPKYHHRLPQRARSRIRHVPTPEAKNDGVHHPYIVISYPEHLDHVLEAPWDLNVKNCGAHYLPRLYHRAPQRLRPRIRCF